MGAESSTMQNADSTLSCHGCKRLGEKQTDTVKVDLGKVLEASAGKENSDPGQMRQSPAQEGLQNKCAEDWKKAEEEARQRAEEERKFAERQQQLQLEELTRQAEEEERQAKEEEEKRRAAEERERLRKQKLAEEEAKARREEEERLRRQKEAEEEEERLASEAREREEAQRMQAWLEEEQRARKTERLRAFLEKSGFQGPNEKKLKKGASRIRLMGSSGFSYPLHAAVELGDAEAIEALLWAGADPSLADSKKQTPLKLAEAKNKQGSHAKVIAALAA